MRPTLNSNRCAAGLRIICCLSLAIGQALGALAQPIPGTSSKLTTNAVPSRQEIEAYAATNKAYQAAMDYIVATLDGRQPEHLPDGVSPADINKAMALVFPSATQVMDAPINFYGKVVDEKDQPIVGAKIHFRWNGFLIHGQRTSDKQTDANGTFHLTNELGRELNVSVDAAGYYSSRRNSEFRFFRFASPIGGLFNPDPEHPVVYYFQKKRAGAEALVTSERGVRNNLWVSAPRDGTVVKFNLMEQKSGSGPLEISQTKPANAKWNTQTNWSFAMKIPNGGFIEENEEFAYLAPAEGYQPAVEFNFKPGETNFAGFLKKDYYIKFGNPALYGHLHVETEIDRETVVLGYSINPTGSRNLEPKNELTPSPQPSAPPNPAH